MYCNAGNEAGQAFEKLAQVHLKQDSRLEAASSYVEAAKCYQKTDKTGEAQSNLGGFCCLFRQEVSEEGSYLVPEQTS